MSYRLKLRVFEGPLELLLQLLRVNEMEIEEIEIAEITRQYLEHLQKMEEMSLEVGGEYLVMAATLMRLKVQSLLPALGSEEEEDLLEIRSREELIRCLLEYRQVKDMAQELKWRAENFAQVIYRQGKVDLERPQERQGNVEMLLSALRRFLPMMEPRSFHILPDQYSVDEKIGLIQSRLAERGRLSLFELFGECREKMEMVVVVLALLELCRVRTIELHQEKPFDDVEVLSYPGRGETESGEQG